MLRLGTFWISGSNLFHSMMTDEKKSIVEEIMFYFEIRNIICVPCKVWSDNLGNYIKNIFRRLLFQDFIKEV